MSFKLESNHDVLFETGEQLIEKKEEYMWHNKLDIMNEKLCLSYSDIVPIDNPRHMNRCLTCNKNISKNSVSLLILVSGVLTNTWSLP